jgi:thiol-disulfide isomerase/thioredoxin
LYDERDMTVIRYFSRKVSAGVNYCVAITIFLILFGSVGHAGWLEVVEPPITPARLELIDLSNKHHLLDDLKGKVVLVNFWATWCPPCIEEMPSLIRLVDSMNSADLQVLAVNVKENRKRVATIASKLGFNFPVLLDASKAAATAWNIKVYPSSFLIDTQGLLRFKAIGPAECDSDASVAQVKSLLAEP